MYNANQIKGVEIIQIEDDWDDGDPVYEVLCNVVLVNNKVLKNIDLLWVRKGQLISLKKPITQEARQDIADLLNEACQKN